MNEVPAPVQQCVLDILQKTTPHAALRSFQPLHGGCINPGGKLDTSLGLFFLKWNDVQTFPDMFAAEAKGLGILRNANGMRIPEVIAEGHQGQYQFLLLEFIEPAPRQDNYWTMFGNNLALLHQSSAAGFGLDHDNYIGSLHQKNTQTTLWTEFFITHRLQAQLTLALGSRLIDSSLITQFERLYHKLPALLPVEKPSLLHGDLWSGNVITTSSGEPCLIDPAVYYGSREADLAMTQLFGGLNNTFLSSYEEIFPLLPGYRERFDLYNLYPLLVHVNLFGRSYLPQIKSVLNRFIS